MLGSRKSLVDQVQDVLERAAVEGAELEAGIASSQARIDALFTELDSQKVVLAQTRRIAGSLNQLLTVETTAA